ncbi:hypothetical protein JW698_02080 [Candidatus Wolfebacteria bacterium]|nr:hypothetical protein [Candidatus Wolfebacteria bacterium]
MYNFILQIIVMLSLGAMIYLMARIIPKISDEVQNEFIRPETKFDKLFSSSRFEKFDTVFNNFIEKILRKVKLLLMRMDNATNNYLDKVKEYKINSNGSKKEEKLNLFENISEEKEELEIEKKEQEEK